MEIINGLYQNDIPLTLEEAKKNNLREILQIRYRICKSCDKSFDITQKGIFYRCCK